MALADRVAALAGAIGTALNRQQKTWMRWEPGTYQLLCPPGYRLEWWMCGPGGAGGNGGAANGGGGGPGGSVIFGNYSATLIGSMRQSWGISANTPLSIYIPPLRSPGFGQEWQTIALADSGPWLGRISSPPSANASAATSAGAGVRASIVGGNGGAGGIAGAGVPNNTSDSVRAGAGACGGGGGGRTATQWVPGGIGGQGFCDSWGGFMGVANLQGGNADGAAGVKWADVGGLPAWKNSGTPVTLGGGGGAGSIAGPGGKGGDGGPGCGGGGGGAGSPGGAGGKGGSGIVSIKLVREGNWN